uniref:F-box domain-containing protein n=1 Tax=Tetradesmus obliquus TaxID=3088 RepID=A0A383WDL0_TETOB|eukprot:jgi/Sobl393_1/7081/SZX75697.1
MREPYLSKDTPDSGLMALTVAVAHPTFRSSPKVLCAAACVCKDWRQEVQECAGCNTDVHLSLRSCSESSTTIAVPPLLPKLQGFASWLAKHGPLVKSLEVDSFSLSDTISDTAVQLLRMGIQQAAATCCVQPLAAAKPPAADYSTTSAAPGATSTGLQQLQQRQQPGLRLASFTSHAPWAVDLLPVLPAHSLTRLQLGWGDSTAGNIAAENYAAALAAALPRLSSLQELVLCGTIAWVPQGEPQVDSCLAVLRQLTRLTCLEVFDETDADEPNSAVHQLLAQPPPRLQELHLGMISSWGLPRPFDFGRLQQLHQLVFHSMEPEVSVLPAQLRHLGLAYCRGPHQLAAVLPLQRLPALSFMMCDGFTEPEQLLRLAQLPARQELRLSSEGTWSAAVATAPAWGQLPQLCELKVECREAHATGRELAAVIAGVAAATALTGLDLQMFSLESPGREDDGHEEHAAASMWGGPQQVALNISASIAWLTRLQSLELSGLDNVNSSIWRAAGLVVGSVCALAALTGLTHLGLRRGGACVDDFTAAALAHSLKQLRRLDVSECELGTMVCLAAIADLPRLSDLQLKGNPGVTQQRLMLLTRLPHLQILSVARNDEVTDAFMDEALSALWFITDSREACWML